MLTSLLALSVLSSPRTIAPVLDDLSRRAVRYFWEQSEPTTGLTRDRGPLREGGKENNGNISSIASTGYALAACAIGAERGWLKRTEAIERARLTLDTVLNRLEGRNGWYYHFVDWKTGKREWNCELSSIDSGLLFAGMVLAERGLKDREYSRLCQQVLDRIDWKFFMTLDGKKPDGLFFSMGWKPESGFLDHYWSSFNELIFLYLLAYSHYPDMPIDSWMQWKRPEIEYKGLKMLVGGPLFLHQMSQGFFDLKGYRDPLGYDYWVEGYYATLGNRLYCIENPKGMKGYSENIWGLSACDIPTGYGAKGAPGWIDDDGTLAPAAAVASVIYTPELSIKAAEAFKKEYPESYGQYGFTTGINPTKDWQSPDVIGIDLGQLMLNIENYRDGLPHRWMMSNPKVQAAYRKIGLRKTSEGDVFKRPLRVGH